LSQRTAKKDELFTKPFCRVGDQIRACATSTYGVGGGGTGGVGTGGVGGVTGAGVGGVTGAGVGLSLF